MEDSDTIGIATVNVGSPAVLAEMNGTVVWSGIAKAPVEPGTLLWLSTINLSGDGQADLSVHGGPDKAVYAYPSEHLGVWADELRGDEPTSELGPAPFGENLSTVGATEPDVCIGDRWVWGEATLEVCQPRWPCFKLALHRRRPDIQLRMRKSGRTGWYLRVLQPGAVRVGDDVEVVFRDPAGLTIRDAHLAMSDRHLDDPQLVRALADHDRLADEWRTPLLDRLA